MTVAASDGYIDVTASAGGQTAFVFDFRLLAASDLVVTKIPLATGVESAALVLDTDYSVTIDGDTGGTVTLAVGLLVGDRVIIKRLTSPVRAADYQTVGDFLADTVNLDFDRSYMALQDARRDLDDYRADMVADLAAMQAEIDATLALSTGPAGASAYEVWLAAGNVGTEADFLASLQGEPGAPGAGTGDVVGPASATDAHIAVFNGTTGKIIEGGGSTIADVLARANHTGEQAISTVTGLQDALDVKEPLGELVGIRTITASETLVLADKGKVIEGNHASVAIVVTVPPNSAVAFPIHTRIDLVRYGAAAMSVAAGAGVTIRSAGSLLAIGAQYAGAQLYKRGTDEWVLIGNLS